MISAEKCSRKQNFTKFYNTHTIPQKFAFFAKTACSFQPYKVHPKSNWKMWITARRLIFFWNFSRHPLLIWLHCFFHHHKTLKAVAMATTAIVVLTPANFYHFRRPEFKFQPLLHFWDLWKKTCRNKNCCLGQREENQSKKIGKKAFKSPAMKRQRFFTKICQ